jgi:hypothetical protein
LIQFGLLVLEKIFFLKFSAFSLFCYYLSLENGYPLSLNKLESPSPKDDLYQVWLNLACSFWRRKFLKMFSVFLLFCYYLPLEEGYPLPLNKLESPSPNDDLCQVWLKLVQWFWRSRKCKSLQTDRQDRLTPDNGRSDFQLRWAKNGVSGRQSRTACHTRCQQRTDVNNTTS